MPKKVRNRIIKEYESKGYSYKDAKKNSVCNNG